jgi:uncharacterized protein YchJ
MLQQQRAAPAVGQQQRRSLPSAAACRAGRAAARAAAARCRRPSLTTAAAAASKGFGANQGKAPRQEDGCPCGSGLLYKACCKPHHQSRAPPPATVEATVRARFSAVVKKEMPFLLKTFHPNFHCVQYSTEPGGASEQLETDMYRTCTDFENSNLRILAVKEDPEKRGEWLAEIQYTTANKRAPEIDGNGNLRRMVRMERDRFVQGEGGWWQLCDYNLADVPEALAKAAQKGKDLPPLEKQQEAGAEEGAAEPTAAA